MSALRHVSLLWLGSLAGAGLAFLTQVLLARHLSAAHYGVFASAIATANLVGPLAAFGVGAYWLKVFGIEGWPARRWLAPSLRFVLLTTSAACALLAGWALLHPAGVTRSVLLWFLPLIAAQAAIELTNARLQLEERYTLLSLWQMASHTGRFLVVAAVVLLGLGLVSVAVGFAAVALILVALATYWVGGMLRGRFDLRGHPRTAGEQPPPVSSWQLPGQAWPFAMAGVFYLIYFQSDIILLNYLAGSESAAVYNVAFTVLAAVYLFPGVLYQKYLLPKLHRWAEHDRSRFLAVFRTGNGSMLVLGLVTMLGLQLTAPWGVPLVFGSEYASAGWLLVALALAVPARFLATSVGGALVTHEHMRRKIRYMGAAALVNVVLNLILIPSYAHFGAAAATVASELLLLVLYLLGARRHVFGARAWTGWNLRIQR